MARLYGNKEKINSKKIKNFFDERANEKVDSILSITMYQDKENVEKRHLEESKIILEKLDLKNKKILEIGCGIGRWAEVLHDKCETYMGIDYSENLIKIAKENYNYENCFFQEMSATDIEIDKLLVKPPFDIILVVGVLIYLNDDDIKMMVNEINKIVTENKTIYIRETISNLDYRLTLKDFYSDNLEKDYNAIYRTENELLNFLAL
ncbi:class I SAM-dependent methyltransferase [Methanobrevibacter sp. DSM 116169]|uniref:class I SAM-dependent methyltransferase n=1 Tax=Methanobrevibacter sp. DSM 116169 TaxID=3242727 RepID=UPI0038FC0FD3